MAANSRKRKATARDASPQKVSGDEFEDGLLSGILSHSEDDTDDSEDEDFESGASSEVDAESADEEEDEDEDLESDEYPSDGEKDIREQIRNLKTTDEPLKRKPSHISRHANLDQLDGSVHGEQDAASDDEDKPNYTVTTDANGNTRYIYKEIDPVYDSDDSDAPEATNTIGNIPLSYYDAYPHIGYDINGKKIMRPAKGEALDALLDSIDIPKGWTGLTDPETGKPLQLSRDSC